MMCLTDASISLSLSRPLSPKSIKSYLKQQQQQKRPTGNPNGARLKRLAAPEDEEPV